MTPELSDAEIAAFEARVRAMSPAQKEAKRLQLEAFFASEERREIAVAAAMKELRAQESALAEQLERLAEDWRACGEALQRVRSQIADVIDNGVPYD